MTMTSLAFIPILVEEPFALATDVPVSSVDIRIHVTFLPNTSHTLILKFFRGKFSRFGLVIIA